MLSPYHILFLWRKFAPSGAMPHNARLPKLLIVAILTNFSAVWRVSEVGNLSYVSRLIPARLNGAAMGGALWVQLWILPVQKPYK
jgi:hypothetical protein